MDGDVNVRDGSMLLKKELVVIDES